MAKSISKHSRAARRGEIKDAAEAKSLSKIPRAENTNIASSIIRLAAKNEGLLQKKMGKNKTRGQPTRIVKERKQKALKMDGKLTFKIEQSLERAKNVQFSRKSGWDSINKNIREELSKGDADAVLKNHKEKAKTNEEMEIEGNIEDEEDEDENEKDSHDHHKESAHNQKNLFALLGDEVET